MGSSSLGVVSTASLDSTSGSAVSSFFAGGLAVSSGASWSEDSASLLQLVLIHLNLGKTVNMKTYVISGAGASSGALSVVAVASSFSVVAASTSGVTSLWNC